MIETRLSNVDPLILRPCRGYFPSLRAPMYRISLLFPLMILGLTPNAFGQGALAVPQYDAPPAAAGLHEMVVDTVSNSVRVRLMPRALARGEQYYYDSRCYGPGDDFPFQWLPDATMDRARSLTGNNTFRAIGQIGLSLPLGSEADALDAAFATTEVVTGHIYEPKKYALYTGEPGDCATSDSLSLTRTLVGIRVLSNFALDPNDAAAAEQRATRSLSTPDGGLVNIQLSRFLGGARQYGFTFLAQAVAGAGLIQVPKSISAEESTGSDHKGTWFLALRTSLEIPIVSIEQDGPNAVSLVLAADPYFRSVPEPVQPQFGDDGAIWGSTFTAMTLIEGSIGIGAVYKLAEGLESTWSLDLVYVR